MKRILSSTEALARLRANRAAASVAAAVSPVAASSAADVVAAMATGVPTYKAIPVVPNTNAATVQGPSNTRIWVAVGVGAVLLVGTGVLIWWLKEQEQKKQQR